MTVRWGETVVLPGRGRSLGFGLALAAGLSAMPAAGRAQVTTDGSLGAARALAGPNYAIDAGLGRQAGGNLFHSFGRFDLRAGESATFSGPASVANVIGRVTGGAPSSIDGTVRVSIPGASLFLLNPAGLMFGPNASLDVRGSFHAGTADYLAFGDGARLLATPTPPGTLSSAPPAAFGFLNAGPAPVQVSGSNLRVPNRATLSLQGGAVTVGAAGQVTAPAGVVGMTGVGGPGEVPVDPLAAQGLTAPVGGPVALTGQASVTVGTSAGGGSAVIRGGQVLVDNATVVSANLGFDSTPSGALHLRGTESVTLQNGATVRTSVFAPAKGGDVAIEGGSVTIASGSTVRTANGEDGRGGDIRIAAAGPVTITGVPGGRVTSVNSVADTDTATPGGDILIAAGALTVDGQARIVANAGGSGRGGNIALAAGNGISVDHGAQIVTQATDDGAAGHIAIRGDMLTLDRQAIVSSLSTGFGGTGDVAVDARSAVRVDGRSSLATLANGAGDGGSLRIATRDMTVEGGSLVNSGSGSGSVARSGDLTITADTLTVRGTTAASASKISSGSLFGPAGSMRITVNGALLLDDGGSVSADTGMSLFESGSIGIDAGSLTLTDGAQISSAAVADGRGGDIRITSRGPVVIDNSLIAADSLFGGPASRGGDIRIEAPSVAMVNGGGVSSGIAADGRGGSVTLLVVGDLLIDGTGSQRLTGISADAQNPLDPTSPPIGDAGSIDVRAGSISVTAASIQSNTFGSGRGGGIRVESRDGITLRRGGQIGASTVGSGRAGDVRVAAGRVSLQQGGQIVSDTFSAGNAGNVAVAVGGELAVSQGDGPLQSRISSASSEFATGNAGNVEVSAGSLRLTDGGFLSTQTDGAGTGGNLAVTAGELFIAGASADGSRRSGIDARSLGPQPAGSIAIAADRVEVRDGGRVTTQSAQAAGGRITIQASDLVFLRSGQITTSVADGSGGGGDITIARPDFVVLNDGTIQANAFRGNGGAIRIASEQFLASPDSLVTATSTLGIDGSISIESPNVDVSGSLVSLSTEFLDASGLLRAGCAARGTRAQSSLAPAGRGGLPDDADGSLTASYAHADAGGLAVLREGDAIRIAAAPAGPGGCGR